MTKTSLFLRSVLCISVLAFGAPLVSAQKTTSPSIYETLDNFNGAFAELKEERDALRQEIEGLKHEQRSLFDGVKARLEASEEGRDRSTDALLEERARVSTLRSEKEKLAKTIETQADMERRFETTLELKDGAIEDVEDENKKLRATLASAKKAYAKAVAQLKRLRGESSSWRDLADRLKASSQKAGLLEGELGLAREKLKLSKERVALSEKAKTELHQRYKDEMAQLRRMHDPLKAKIEALEEERFKDAKIYQDRRDEAQADSLTWQKEVLELQTQNSMLESRVASLDTKTEGAEARVLDLEKERATLRQQVDALKEELGALKRDKRAAADEKTALEKKLNEALKDKAGLEKEESDRLKESALLSKERDALAKDKKALTEAKADLEEELKEALKDKSGLEKEKSGMLKERALLNKERDALVKDKEILTEAKADLEKELSEVKGIRKDLEKEKSGMLKERVLLNKERDALVKDKKILTEAKADLEKELSEVKGIRKGLEKEKSGTQKELALLGAENDALVKDKKVLGEAKAELEQQLAKVLDEKADFERETKQKTGAFEKEVKRLQVQLKPALEKISAFEKEKKTLLKALDQGNQALADAEKSVVDTGKANKGLEADLKVAKKEQGDLVRENQLNMAGLTKERTQLLRQLKETTDKLRKEKTDLLIEMKNKHAAATKKLRRDNLEYHTTIKRLEKTLSKKTMMLEKAEHEGKALAADVRDAQDILSSLKKGHEAYVEQLQEDFSDALAYLRTQVKSAREELDEAKKTNKALSDTKVELKKLTKEKAGLQKKIAAFNDQIFKDNMALAQSATTEKENRLLKTNMGDLLEKYNKTNTQNKKLVQRFEAMKREWEGMKKEQAGVTAALSESKGLKRENQGLHGKLATTEAKLRNLLNKLVDLQSDNQDLKEKTRTRISPRDFRETKDSNKKMEHENTLLKRRVAQLESALEGMRSAKEELIKVSKKQKSKISRMNSRLDAWDNESEGWTRSEKKVKKVLGAKSEKIGDLREVLAETQDENKKLQARVDDFAGQHAAMNVRLEELEKENSILHYNLGVIYTEKAMYEQAVKEYEKALERNPADPYPAYNLGIIYSQYLIDEDEAVKYFRRYLERAPQDEDANRARKYIMTRDSYDLST